MVMDVQVIARENSVEMALCRIRERIIGLGHLMMRHVIMEVGVRIMDRIVVLIESAISILVNAFLWVMSLDVVELRQDQHALFLVIVWSQGIDANTLFLQKERDSSVQISARLRNVVMVTLIQVKSVMMAIIEMVMAVQLVVPLLDVGMALKKQWKSVMMG
jgi:hypothetical protein